VSLFHFIWLIICSSESHVETGGMLITTRACRCNVCVLCMHLLVWQWGWWWVYFVWPIMFCIWRSCVL